MDLNITAKYTVKTGMLCWNPGTDQVAVVEWPDTFDLLRPYQMTGLACYLSVAKLTRAECTAKVYVEAMHLIIRDRCNPDAVHRALLEIDEYRSACAEDMPDYSDY